eukprot:SAG31_NODE_1740_length_7394_cov_7.518849_5_plen_63_part_00
MCVCAYAVDGTGTISFSCTTFWERAKFSMRTKFSTHNLVLNLNLISTAVYKHNAPGAPGVKY